MRSMVKAKSFGFKILADRTLVYSISSFCATLPEKFGFFRHSYTLKMFFKVIFTEKKYFKTFSMMLKISSSNYNPIVCALLYF